MLQTLLRYRLAWRLIAPTLGLSVLLLLMGGVSGWYVHRTNARSAETLDGEIEAIFDAEELLLAVRDVRRQLERFEASGDTEYLDAAIAGGPPLVARLKAARGSTPPQDTEVTALLLAMDESQRRCLERLAQLPRPTDGGQVTAIRQDVASQLLVPAERVLEHRRGMVRQGSSRSLELADQIGIGLVALGVSGSLAGLLAGAAIARGMMRSLEQLGVSVRQLLGTLETNPAPRAQAIAAPGELPDESPILATDDLLPRLRDSLRTATARSASVVQELQEARRKSERSDQLAAVGQLAAGLAHELRNPLTAMKLLAQAAQERDRPLQGDELRILEEEILRLEQLLQTFLDFARPARLKMERVEVGTLVERTVDLARRRANRQEITLLFDAPLNPLFLEADASQLRQVVLNLLLNALDAQREGGCVTIRLGQEINDAGQPEAVLVVRDEGPGIPPGWHEKIFEAFASTKETGIGLGLTICRRIVESHGGRITARSRRDKGAEFEVRLPSVAQRDRGALQEERQAGSTAGA